MSSHRAAEAANAQAGGLRHPSDDLHSLLAGDEDQLCCLGPALPDPAATDAARTVALVTAG